MTSHLVQRHGFVRSVHPAALDALRILDDHVDPMRCLGHHHVRRRTPSPARSSRTAQVWAPSARSSTSRSDVMPELVLGRRPRPRQRMLVLHRRAIHTRHQLTTRQGVGHLGDPGGPASTCVPRIAGVEDHEVLQIRCLDSTRIRRCRGLRPGLGLGLTCHEARKGHHLAPPCTPRSPDQLTRPGPATCSRHSPLPSRKGCR